MPELNQYMADDWVGTHFDIATAQVKYITISESRRPVDIGGVSIECCSDLPYQKIH